MTRKKSQERMVDRTASSVAAAALAEGEQMPRSAGPSATRDESNDDWTQADEADDQSFPASDPPAY